MMSVLIPVGSRSDPSIKYARRSNGQIQLGLYRKSCVNDFGLIHFGNPEETKEVRYVVKGGALLWVFQEEDYNRTISWHGYKKEAKDKKRR